MRITEIREMAVPLVGNVANAVVSFDKHHVSLVAVGTDVVRHGARVWGTAFNSIGRHAQGGILRDRMIPRILGADPESLLDPDSGVLDPARVVARAMTDEKPGGHGDRSAAASAVELAVWDAVAKLRDEPAYATIARAYDRTPDPAGVPVYAAGGYYVDGDPSTLLREEILGYLEQGYDTVKIKVGGRPTSVDIARIDTAIDTIGDGARVAVDANGRLSRETALAYAAVLAPYGLRWFEEPVDPLAYGALRDVAAAYGGALATGENLFSVQDVRNLLEFAGLRPGTDILQMDAGLSYGLTEYARMVGVAHEHGFGPEAVIPHGGHLINLHIVAGLALGGCEAYPGVFHPFGGYGRECTVESGRIRPPQRPGFGLEDKDGLVEPIRQLIAN